MRDPAFDGQNVPEQRFKNFLEGRPRKYEETDPVKLQRQINGLSDMLVLVVKERDQLQTDLRQAKQDIEKHRWLSVKFWILSGVVAVEAPLIFWLATELLSRLR